MVAAAQATAAAEAVEEAGGEAAEAAAQEVVLAYARYLGMVPDDRRDRALLWVAEEALKQPEPPGWSQVQLPPPPPRDAVVAPTSTITLTLALILSRASGAVAGARSLREVLLGAHAFWPDLPPPPHR